jgi:hypothetical protein
LLEMLFYGPMDVYPSKAVSKVGVVLGHDLAHGGLSITGEEAPDIVGRRDNRGQPTGERT